MKRREKNTIDSYSKIYGVFYQCKLVHLGWKENSILPNELTQFVFQTATTKIEIGNLSEISAETNPASAFLQQIQIKVLNSGLLWHQYIFDSLSVALFYTSPSYTAQFYETKRLFPQNSVF